MLPGRVDRHWGGRREYFPDGTPAGLGGGNPNLIGKAAASADDQAAARQAAAAADDQAAARQQPAQAAAPPGTPGGAASQQQGAQGAAGTSAQGAQGGAAPRPVPAGTATGTVQRRGPGAQQQGEPMSVDNPHTNRLPAFEQLTQRGQQVQFPEFRPRQQQQQQQQQQVAQGAQQIALGGDPYPMHIHGHMGPPPNEYYQIPTHPPPAQPFGNVIVAYPPPGFVIAEHVHPYNGQPQFVTPVYPLQAQPYNYYPPNAHQQFVTPPHSIFQQPPPQQFPVPSAPPQHLFNQPLPQPAPVQVIQHQPAPPPRFPLNEYPPLGQAGARARPPQNAPNPSQNQRRSVPMDGVEPTVQRQAPQPAAQPAHRAPTQASNNPQPSTSSSSSTSNLNPNTHDAHLHSQHVSKLNGGYILQSKLYRLTPKPTNQQQRPQQPHTNPNVRPSTSQHAHQPMETQPPASSNPKHSTPKGKSSSKHSSKHSHKRKAESRMTQSPPTKRPKDGSSDKPFQLSSSDDDFVQR